MGDKNPFLKSGKRKRKTKRAKKSVGTKQDDKLFCPRLMIRYDQDENSQIEYKTLWVCKMCTTCILNENAVNSHLMRCRREFKNSTFVYEPVIPNEAEESRYICRLCSRVFSRKVTLMKHLEVHEKTSDSELYESDSELVIPRKRRKRNTFASTSLGNRKQIASTSTSSVDNDLIAVVSATSLPKHLDEHQKTSDSELCESDNVSVVPQHPILPPAISLEGQIESTSSSLDLNTLEVSELNDNDENTVEH